MQIWNKYKKIKEIDSKSNIKTYLARIEPIIKEIIPKDKDDSFIIIESLEKLKEKFNIYEIIKENEKIYIVLENNEEILSKLDELIISDVLNVKKEFILEGHGNPVAKEEIFNLFNFEKSICKISFESSKGEKCKGTGFFCEIDKFPIKYALFTNNHILSESAIEIGNTINFEYLEKSYFGSSYNISQKNIKITQNRKVSTNRDLDYTCIELFESDGIKDYFKIDPKLFKNDKNNLKDNDIFILQYPNDKDLSFSYGKISSIEGNNIKHTASTCSGSSGSPIIRRTNNYIIGLHYGVYKNEYNLATTFDSILNDIKEHFNEINCIYAPIKDEREIFLLHNYDNDANKLNENIKKEYIEAKNLNKKLFEENIDIYINDKKINFDFKYKIKDSKEIRAKFKFKKILTNTSYMFSKCSSLKSIDLSLFNTNKVNKMIDMFSKCSSLESIDLSSFNTNNVINMKSMFFNCSSLESINLSSFDTKKVINMSGIFSDCSSLKSIDLSSFNTNNVKDMTDMFFNCSSLKSIDLSSFNTNNVNNMSYMFSDCSSLKSIDLSSFNTNNVKDMSYMFYKCSSLKSIDLSSFNTNEVKDMSYMFAHCSSLNSIDLSLFNTNNINISGMFSDCSSLKKDNIII